MLDDYASRHITNYEGDYITTRRTWIENGICEFLISLKLWATNNFHHGFKLGSKLLVSLLLLASGVTNGIRVDPCTIRME